MELTKAVIYYRVSTTEQAEHGFSLEHQKEACLKYAESNGYKVIKHFSDEGESAKSAKRPGLQDMLKYCGNKNNRVEAIIVYKVDRLTRNSDDYTYIGTYLRDRKISIVSTTEAIDKTPFGKFMGTLAAALAQLDNDVRSQRVTAGMVKCVESGRMPHKVKLGYLNHTKPDGSKTIILDPVRADLVRFILVEFSKGIYTSEELRVKVNKLGLRTRENREISPQMMNKILTSKFYYGWMSYAGKEYLGKHEALIGEEVYLKNQQLLRKYTKGQTIANARHDEEFPLRHMIICGYCSRPLTAAWSVGKMGVRYPYYRCYFKQCPTRKNIAKAKLETEFAKFLEDFAPKKELLDAFKAVIIDVWQGRYAEVNSHYDVLQKELSALKQEKEQILELVKKQLIDDQDFKEQFEQVKNKINDKQLQLTDTRLEEFDIDEAVTFVFDFIEQLPQYWSQASYWQKVKLMGLIFPEKPVYMYKAFSTRKTSHIFNAKAAHAGGLNCVVAPRGIEPRFTA